MFDRSIKEPPDRFRAQLSAVSYNNYYWEVIDSDGRPVSGLLSQADAGMLCSRLNLAAYSGLLHDELSGVEINFEGTFV